jgi:hypothetical protein
MPIFLDDQVGRSRRDDQLDRRVLMPRHDEEPSAFCADSLVVEAGQLDEVGARDPRAFADELVVVSTEPSGEALDRLVHLSKKNLSIREALFALVGGRQISGRHGKATVARI